MKTGRKSSQWVNVRDTDTSGSGSKVQGSITNSKPQYNAKFRKLFCLFPQIIVEQVAMLLLDSAEFSILSVLPSWKWIKAPS